MKKTVFFTLILVFLTIPIFAQNDSKFNFNIGNLGIGANFPLSNEYEFETHFSMVSFGLEDRNTGLGFSFSPFVVTFWPSSSYYGEEDGYYFYSDEEMGDISLINFSVYWNMFSGRSFYFGPFASINFGYVDTEFHWDKLIYTAGIQMGMRLSFKGFNYTLFSVEAGYRNIHGTSKYYISGKIDILTLIFTTWLGYY